MVPDLVNVQRERVEGGNMTVVCLALSVALKFGYPGGNVSSINKGS